MNTGLTENGLYTAHAALWQHQNRRWYIYVTDDNGNSQTALCVENLPTERDTLVMNSFQTRFMIAVDYDPAHVKVVR